LPLCAGQSTIWWQYDKAGFTAIGLDQTVLGNKEKHSPLDEPSLQVFADRELDHAMLAWLNQAVDPFDQFHKTLGHDCSPLHISVSE
jgi:hypothetical protein